MLKIEMPKPIKRELSKDASYTSEEIAEYIEIANRQLEEDMRVIRRAECESWESMRYKIF